MNIAYPYRFDRRGRTADADIAAHLRDLIEQVLFTAPGERVMRPSFGSGINALVFAPGGDTLATAVQSTVQAALQQWLGDRAQVVSVTAESDDSRLHVEVRYAPLHSDVIETTRFTRTL
ncbi:MAG: GPW/gp25 family protein [Gammaproteobacteria bacterium]|nr:GPW/gp25 family protein [Gammaproteobacteria bacterium]